VGDHQGIRPGVGGLTMFEYIISGVVAVFLLVYLGWAMFQPERF
jgi:K+-transporting ATPase KdpF subunit